MKSLSKDPGSSVCVWVAKLAFYMNKGVNMAMTVRCKTFNPGYRIFTKQNYVESKISSNHRSNTDNISGYATFGVACVSNKSICGEIEIEKKVNK